MLRILKSRRRIVLVLPILIGVVLAVMLLAGYLWGLADDAKLRRMQPYTVEQQQKHGEALIAGLNSRNPEQVDLFHTDDDEAAAARARITRNVEAAMPNPGCHYVLESVHDDGEQGRRSVGWLGNGNGGIETYQYHLSVIEVCPNAHPVPLKIGVIAVPSGMAGQWADAALSIEQ